MVLSALISEPESLTLEFYGMQEKNKCLSYLNAIILVVWFCILSHIDKLKP